MDIGQPSSGSTQVVRGFNHKFNFPCGAQISVFEPLPDEGAIEIKSHTTSVLIDTVRETRDCTSFEDDDKAYIECLKARVRDLEARLEEVKIAGEGTCSAIHTQMLASLQQCRCD